VQSWLFATDMHENDYTVKFHYLLIQRLSTSLGNELSRRAVK